MLLAAIVLVRRCRGAVGDLVGELELLEVEQLAGNHPPLHPPLVGIDQPLRLARRRQQRVRGVGDLVGAAQPLNAAEQVARVVARRRRHCLQRRLGPRRLVDDRGAGLGDREFGRIEMARGAHAGLVVVGIEADIHPHLVVGRSDQTGERGAGLPFKVCGKTVVAPRFAHCRLRAGLVALREQGARERKSALGAVRPLAGEEGDDRLRIGALLPQRRLGAAPQRNEARPARIGGKERDVAGEIHVGVAAQDHPFDHLARERVGDGTFGARRLVEPRLAHEVDRLLDRGQIERRGVRRRRHRQRDGGVRGARGRPRWSRRPLG